MKPKRDTKGFTWQLRNYTDFGKVSQDSRDSHDTHDSCSRMRETSFGCAEGTPSAQETCPRCGGELTFVETPELVHYGKVVCSKCGRFIKWVTSPQKEGLRNITSKFSIMDVMKHKGFNGEPFCFFCGRVKAQLGYNETLTLDHIIPLRENGEDTIENLQILCSACHKLRHWAELYTNKHLNLKVIT